MTQYQTVLQRKVADVSRHGDYKKWLRYFWDFCAKYPGPESGSERVRLFIEKLKAKKQTPDQQKQAAHAVSLFLERERPGEVSNSHIKTTASNPSTSPQDRATTGGLPLQVSEKATTPFTPRNHNSPYPPLILRGGGEAGGVTVKGEYASPSKHWATTEGLLLQEPKAARPSSNSHFNEWRCLEKAGSPEWDKLIDTLATEIKLRHYSRKTLKTYADWNRNFQGFLQNKPPDQLSAADVKTYLAFLAVKRRVSASTQDQALSSAVSNKL